MVGRTGWLVSIRLYELTGGMVVIGTYSFQGLCMCRARVRVRRVGERGEGGSWRTP